MLIQAIRRVVPVVAALTLGACATVGPDYSEPQIEWLQTTETKLYGEVLTLAPEQAVDLSAWWRQYNDPTLNRLIDLALEENPGLRIAGLRMLESRALAAAAGATLYPQVQTVGANAAYAERSGGIGKNGFSSWNAGLTIGWELDFWGRFQRSITSADAGFMASVANQRDAQVLLTATVADVYWQYRTTVKRVAVLKKNAAQQKRSFDITRLNFEAGQQSELDFQQAKTQYLATLASLPALELAEVKLVNALCAALGRGPGDLPELVPSEAPLPVAQNLAVASPPSSLIQRRPDVRASLWRVAAQSEQIGIAEADYYPSIAIGGNLSWAGNSLLGNGSTATLGAGPSVNWTVFDWGRIANNVRIQDARLQQLIEQYRATVIAAAREINDAAMAVEKTGEQRQLLADTVAASERALDLATDRYHEGYADFQRVLDAQRVVFSQADRKLQNDGAHLSAVVELFKALGGGWRPQDMTRAIGEDNRQQMQDRTDWGDLMQVPVADVTKPQSESSLP